MDTADTALHQLFEAMAKRSRLMIGLLVAVIAISAAVALFLNRREAESGEARNALYVARKSVETETKTAATALAPATPKVDAKPDVKKDAGKDAKGAKTDAKASDGPSPADVAALEFKKLDVDKTYPESLKKLRAVAEQYPGTRAAFEATLAGGDLYLSHGEPEKSLDWYQRALTSPPDHLAKAFALSALAYAYENAGKSSDAVQYFQKAIDQGEAAVKGDALLGLARSYESMNDTAKARSTYDQIVSQMPGTDTAKTAELYRGQLK